MNKNKIVVVSTHLETDLLHIGLASLAPPWPDTLALEVVRHACADVVAVGAGGAVLSVNDSTEIFRE